MRCKRFPNIAAATALLLAIESRATIYYSTSLENVSCGHEINDEVVDGRLWDTGQNSAAGAAFPFPLVQCTLPTPSGSKHVEWRTQCSAGYTGGDRCATANNENVVTMSAFTDIGIPTHSVVDGRTYYLGAFLRYSRINSRDVWLDTGTPNSWDKTLEFRGSGFRWGIGVGWPQGNFTGTDHRFTFDVWCADTAFVGCQTSGNADHKLQNDNGYSGNTPFLAEYDRWYAVVIKVTASTTTAGRVELFVNGVRVTNKTSQITYSAGATIEHVEMLGTIGQAEYATPEHLIFMDEILMTDALADVQAAGLLSDPSNTTRPAPPPAPTGLVVR